VVGGCRPGRGHSGVCWHRVQFRRNAKPIGKFCREVGVGDEPRDGFDVVEHALDVEQVVVVPVVVGGAKSPQDFGDVLARLHVIVVADGSGGQLRCSGDRVGSGHGEPFEGSSHHVVRLQVRRKTVRLLILRQHHGHELDEVADSTADGIALLQRPVDQ
jgi:hypothetical protein